MANYQLLKADIDAKVYENAHREITGENLNAVLNAMVTTLGAGYQFAGVATIDTNPENPDTKVFYIANGKGTYTNFGGIEVTEDDVVILYWDSAWHKVSTGIASNSKLLALFNDVDNVKTDVAAIERDLGQYAELPSVTMTAEMTGKYINADGEFVDDADFNIAAIGAVVVGNTYELYMGSADKMKLGVALFVARIKTTTTSGTERTEYVPLFSAMSTDIPTSGYVCFEAMDAYSDVLVCYRADVPEAATLLVRRYGTKASIATQINNLISRKQDKLTPITYAELIALRDSSSLVAGVQYRITDYDFTTTEEDTDSAHQLFDIIVTADSKSVLNETARAVHHQYESSEEALTGAIKLYKTDMGEYADKVDTGDYFLLAGTVEVDRATYYRYDKYEDGVNTGRYILLESIDLDSLGIGLDKPLYPVGNGTYGEDGSYMSHFEDAIVAYENGVLSDDPLFVRDIASWELKYTLKNTKHSSSDGKGTVLWMKDEFRNECNYDFINALFKVYEITACAKLPSLVGTYVIKTDSSNITYGTNSKLVSTFGADNHDNVIKYDGLAKIVLGNNCHSNTFGNNCRLNTFGNDCFSNIFGDDCHFNTFGNNCFYNSFGNHCYSNTFGNNCNFIKFAFTSSAITKYNYYQNNYFGDGCQYLLFKGAGTESYSTQVQNYNFAQGLQGTISEYLTIDGVRSRAYETKVAKNSSGELKIYCEADFDTIV